MPAIAEIVSTAPVIEFAAKPTLPEGRYAFATGRRKTAVANIRLFAGLAEHQVNRKPFNSYFHFTPDQNKALKALTITGLAGDFHFTAQVTGGGIHAQAQAVQHGIAKALADLSPEVRRVLKKNGMLTRDDRKKERKKPGLKRARRRPQWAKR